MEREQITREDFEVVRKGWDPDAVRGAPGRGRGVNARSDRRPPLRLRAGRRRAGALSRRRGKPHVRTVLESAERRRGHREQLQGRRGQPRRRRAGGGGAPHRGGSGRRGQARRRGWAESERIVAEATANRFAPRQREAEADGHVARRRAGPSRSSSDRRSLCSARSPRSASASALPPRSWERRRRRCRRRQPQPRPRAPRSRWPDRRPRPGPATVPEPGPDPVPRRDPRSRARPGPRPRDRPRAGPRSRAGARPAVRGRASSASLGYGSRGSDPGSRRRCLP